MITALKHHLAIILAAVLLGGPALLAPPTAEAAAALTCRARVSDSTPAQYSTVYVYVKTAPRAKVRAVAHYRTTDTGHSKKANSKGKATIGFYISGATPGYRVRVDVTVRKNGHKRTCSTSFRPHS